MGYQKKTVAIVALIIVLMAGSFYVGTRYEKSKLTKIGATSASTTPKASKKSATSVAIPEPAPAPANQILGTIATKTPKGVITLTLNDKTTATVGTVTTTKYGDTGAGTFADVTVGEAVAIITTGVKAADGSWVAESIKPAPVVSTTTTPAVDTTKKKVKKSKSATDTTATDTTATDASVQ